MSIFSNTYFPIPYNPSSILLNLFLSLSQSQCSSIFFNLSFSISFYSTSINVNFFLSSCQSSWCLSFPITNFKLFFYPSLSLITTKEDQSTTKIFYFLFLWGWLYFMANEVILLCKMGTILFRTALFISW